MGTTNHEYYVSLEVAKLLKEAGFDWKCREYYHNFTTTGWSLSFDDNFINWQQEGDNYLSAPTLDVAQRWLREVKNISVEAKSFRWVNRYQDDKYTVTYRHELWPIDTSIIPSEEDKFIRYTLDCACDIEFQTYEQALEAGIKKCLTLLLEEKK